MKKLIPFLVVALVAVGCESRADKIKRACSAWVLSADGSVFSKNLEAEIYKLSGGTKEQLSGRTFEFCRPYLGR